MSRVKNTLAIGASVLAIAVAGVVHADTVAAPEAAAPEAKAETSAGVSGAAKLETAYRLAAYGREKSDPQALILSAKMMNEVGAQDAEITGTTTGAVEDATAKEAKPQTTAGSLLDEAEALARGDEAVLTQIAEVRASAQKGFVGGVRRSVLRLPARSVWSWTGTAIAGQQAIAVAQGDGDTDIDMRVLDGNGNVICHDRMPDYTPACSWTPAWTGNFTLQLINNGNVYSDTVFVTN